MSTTGEKPWLHALCWPNVTDWSRKRLVACYPVPLVLALIAWFTFPPLFILIPLPIIPVVVTIIGVIWIVKLTNRLAPATLAGIAIRILLITIYVIAIFLAWPFGCGLYSYLGFPEPFP